jgi:hypothetical protein
MMSSLWPEGALALMGQLGQSLKDFSVKEDSQYRPIICPAIACTPIAVTWALLNSLSEGRQCDPGVTVLILKP